MDSKIIQIEQLGGNVEELTAIRDSLELEKESLLEARTRSNKQIRDLRNRVEGYRELLVMKDVEIEELKKVNEELVVENKELKTERNVLNQNLRDAEKTRSSSPKRYKLPAGWRQKTFLLRHSMIKAGPKRMNSVPGRLKSFR
jgi:chromosome segregation ATPase